MHVLSCTYTVFIWRLILILMQGRSGSEIDTVKVQSPGSSGSEGSPERRSSSIPGPDISLQYSWRIVLYDTCMSQVTVIVTRCADELVRR